MRQRNTQKSFGQKAADFIDNAVTIFNPAAGLRRKAARFAYDAVKSNRLNTKRQGLGGTGDVQLDEYTHDGLREICREMFRNNALVRGLLMTERNGVVGDGVNIQAATEDDTWNETAEQLWQSEMVDKSCDVTGRFNFNDYLRKMYLTYRRDGDMATIYTSAGLQAIEGERIKTPYSFSPTANLICKNGIAFSAKTGAVIGYFVGEPDLTGNYIKSDSFEKFKAEDVHFHFHPERFSQSRGEPALASSIKYIDYTAGYVDAELVAAKINACFAVFVTKKDAAGGGLPPAYNRGVSSTGKNDDGVQLDKIEPGMIHYGEPGEDVKGIGMTRPSTEFDPFVLRMLALIGRPLCMPLMLITLDYAGATFMNARIAYQKAQEMWMSEQKTIIVPFTSRTYRWKLDQWIAAGLLADREDKYKHRVMCNRWPYVDPIKEAKADEQELLNGTTTRTRIIARKGDDFKDIIDERDREERYIKEKGLILDPKNSGVNADEPDTQTAAA